MLLTPANLFVLLLSAAALLLAVRLLQRRRVSSPPAAASPTGRRILARAARLLGFALLAFVCLGLSVLVYIDYQQVSADIAPAPSIVEIPPDLPFAVEEVRFAAPDGAVLAGWLVAP